MVRELNMQHLFDVSSKTQALNLPVTKENGFKILYNDNVINKTLYSGKEPILPFAASEVFRANINCWRRLTATSGGRNAVYEMTLDIKGSNFRFKPGDTIGVIPQNNNLEVNSIIEHLDIATQADHSYELTVNSELKGVKVPAHVPVESTLRHVLTHCLDIRSVLKKVFLLALSRHTKEEQERRVLEYLCSREGSTMYNTYVLDRSFCLLDLFNTFKSCVPPVEIVLTHLPRLLPRPYSIVNSQLSREHILKICFSVIESDYGRKGLTTGYLENILNEDIENAIRNLSISSECKNPVQIPIYLRKNINGFHMSEDITERMLLIGPGTGVAPFIGFLEERAKLKERDSTLCLGDVWVLFGCRDPKLDHLYEKEMQEFVSKGVLTKLSTAFSRVDGAEAKYVQDLITNNGEEIAKFIKNGATIFVCGDLKTIATQVKDCIKQTLEAHGEQDADTYVAQLERERKYLVDIWS